MMLQKLCKIATLLFLMAVTFKTYCQPLNADKKLNDITQNFFITIYQFSPTQGTAAGFHQYDGLLDDYRKLNIQQQILRLNQLLLRLEKIDLKTYSLEQRVDLQLMTSYAKAQILNLQNIKMWQKNPQFYTDLISNSIFQLSSRHFASPVERLRAVIKREQKIPELLKSARENISNPPALYCQLTLESIPGVISFFQKDVLDAFKEVQDTKLKKEFHEINNNVVQALKSYQVFVDKKLLPHAHGHYALGENIYAKMLSYNENITTNLQDLLKEGYNDLRHNQALLKKISKQINPNAPLNEVIRSLYDQHPDSEHLIPDFKTQVTKIKNYILTKHIVTIPRAPDPIFIPTPSFAAALTTAAMETPGIFDKKNAESFFEITLPSKNATPAEVNEYLSGFNKSSIATTAAHEVYPGHYLQYLWMKNIHSTVRKLIGADSNSEGWAHYCEQMILDEGYGKNDPYLRLGQLLDALLRDARYIVSIQMHTLNMDLNQAKLFFQNEAYLTPTNALIEAKRGSNDPLYLSYTLGKLEILRLRDQYKSKQGKKFSLEEFHNQFLMQGYPPIPLVRKILLSN